jgi:hypothetical protein
MARGLSLSLVRSQRQCLCLIRMVCLFNCYVTKLNTDLFFRSYNQNNHQSMSADDDCVGKHFLEATGHGTELSCLGL